MIIFPFYEEGYLSIERENSLSNPEQSFTTLEKEIIQGNPSLSLKRIPSPFRKKNSNHYR
jgi:hypothetical protein